MTFSDTALQRHAAEHAAMKERGIMPGKRFSKKEDRQAAHVAKSMKKRGKSAKEAKSIGYATVTKRKRTNGKKDAKKAAKSAQARNLTSKTKPPRKAANRASRNKGRR